MLPTADDNGARLAAILPSGIAALARGVGGAAVEHLRADAALPRAGFEPADALALDALPAIRSFVLIVVDGLGTANLNGAKQFAPALTRYRTRRIETVLPSTTGAALTSLTTGALPGAHGLLGYRIRHPELGVRNTLSEWEGIDDVRSWQLVPPLWERAARMGVRVAAIGRPAHRESGLTEAILSGAEYHPAATIDERFAVASALVRRDEPALVYLYIDELDRAGHADGWRSESWVRRLADLDTAFGHFASSIPGDVGIALTADHGMIDVPEHRRLIMGRMDGVAEIGGEPRMRYLYLERDADAHEVARHIADSLGSAAWVGTREQAVQLGWFGPMDERNAARIGDVIVTPRGETALFPTADDPALAMVGQHGGLSSEERGVPLLLAGALEGSGFDRVVRDLAASAKR